jgi:DNA-binding NarL/FixJ family response regulator
MSIDASEGELKGRLTTLRERIASLGTQAKVASLPFTRLAAPLMRALGWEPELRTTQLAGLVEQLRQSELEPEAARSREFSRRLLRAMSELGGNVRCLERALIVRGRLPPAHVDFLQRMWEVLLLAEKASRGEQAAWARRRVEALERRGLDGPLEVAEDGKLAALDALVDSAESEHEQLGRRRRLLEAARALLLDAAASRQLSSHELEKRKRYLARAIVQLDRYEATGLDPRVGLSHQARRAKDRGDIGRLHAALTALEEFSLCSGDERLGALTGRALERLWRERDRFAPEAQAESLAQSEQETFDPRVQAAITEGYERALACVPALRAQAAAGEVKTGNVDLVEAYLAQENLPLLLQAALSVDGCFDVGGVLTPVRVVEERRFPRLVNHPTPHLVLAQAEGPRDVPQAIIGDPRTVLLELAAGSLQTRRYVAEEVKRHARTVLQGEVRVYVLDGSGSMLGPRARMRDAILVAELSTLLARLGDPLRSVKPTLFYRYFTRTLSATVRVDTEAEALAAIAEALSEARFGGTDIQLALLESFELVRTAKLGDPDLARAQIVLVTDGNAHVDADAVQRAREAVGALPIGVSIIALGEENEALKALAARQRARGERTFYQYISDAEIEDCIRGSSLGAPVHLPKDARPAELAAAVSDLVDEIEASTRKATVDELEQAREQRAALSELSLSLARDFSETERAKAEAAARDLGALERRFQRSFPALPVSADLDSQLPPEDDLRDLTQLEQLLGTVSEVVELVGGERLARMADAIEVFERLLPDSGLTTARSVELRKRYPARLQAAFATLRQHVLGNGDAPPA